MTTSVYIIDHNYDSTCSSNTWTLSYLMIPLIFIHLMQSTMAILDNFSHENLSIQCLKVNGGLSGILFMIIFVAYLYLDVCQEGMKLWIKTDMVVYLASVANYAFHFYFETAKIVAGLNEKEKIHLERLIGDEGEEEERKAGKGQVEESRFKD